jgi:hypothetical protein
MSMEILALTIVKIGFWLLRAVAFIGLIAAVRMA